MEEGGRVRERGETEGKGEGKSKGGWWGEG